jgi:hypothetical protein
MSEHSHSLNAAMSGLSALAGTAPAFAATRATARFVKHDDLPFHALIEPAQDAIRAELAQNPFPFVLAVHD